MMVFFEKAERTYSKTMMIVLAFVFGPRAAIAWMTFFPFRRRTKARITWLNNWLARKYGQASSNDFVVQYLSGRPRTQDIRTLLCLPGEYRISTEALEEGAPQILLCLRKNPVNHVTLIMSILARGDIALAMSIISDAQGKFHENERNPALFSQNLRSIFFRPLGQAVKLSEEDGVPQEAIVPPSCEHRLVVFDGKIMPSIVRHLSAGAKKLTLIRYGDLYGKININAIREELPDLDITIEHARTRISRFQNRYHEMHKISYDVAHQFTDAFLEGNPWVKNLPFWNDRLADAFCLNAADILFFRMLRFDGLMQAIKDSKFDSVIINFSDNAPLDRLYSSDPELLDDPRILVCCWSESPTVRAKFDFRQAEIRKRARSKKKHFPLLRTLQEVEEDPLTEAPDIVGEYLSGCSSAFNKIGGDPDEGRLSVALVTHEGRSYGINALQTALALEERFDVDVIWTQGKESSFFDYLKQAEESFATSGLGNENLRHPAFVQMSLPALSLEAIGTIADATLTAATDRLTKTFANLGGDFSVLSAIDVSVGNELTGATLTQLARAALIAAFFKENRYNLVALCPGRTPSVAIFAQMARAAGIPTLTIEPHCLNASYCRYTTIMTDYAAVYSDYFVQEYDRYFGVDMDRVRAFGSPRIMKPQNYDSDAARIAAKELLGLDADSPPFIFVPTQPMSFDFILPLWRMVIQAARDLNQPVSVILKIHPEEGPESVERYRQIIAEEDAADFCSVLDGGADVNIKDMLMACHLVLTGYSVTALEAVILDRNVAIIGYDEVDYPLSYEEVIGLPFCTTRAETRTVIEDALTLGLAAPSGAESFRKKNPFLFENSTFLRLQQIIDDIVQRGPSGIRPDSELPESLFVTAPFREYSL